MENFRIGVEGNIGSGKSTVVENLISRPLSDIILAAFPLGKFKKVVAFDEIFTNEVLDAFYGDPVKYAYVAQNEFFNGRLEREKKAEKSSDVIIEDRTIAADYHIFGLAQKKLNNMSPAEFLAYSRTYKLMTEKIKSPDMIIYLKADIAALMKRIEKRGRESEKLLLAKPEYLILLNELYDAFIEKEVSCPVLTIDANEAVDFDNEEEVATYLRKTAIKIAEKIRSLEMTVSSHSSTDWLSLSDADATVNATIAETTLRNYLKENPSLITIAGDLASGKSLLATIMEYSLGIKGIYEAPQENELLWDFLKDKKTHCNNLQLSFLEMRSAQRREGKKGDMSYVKDRSLAEDLLIFCELFHNDGYLTDEQLNHLYNKFMKVNSELPSADLMLVLRSTPEVALKRMQQRGRPGEVNGGWSEREIRFLNSCYPSYPDNVRKYGFHTKPILKFNVVKLDLLNLVHRGYMYEQMYESLSGKKVDYPDRSRKV